jgi:two-component system chemotaxis sensor kinase CheA
LIELTEGDDDKEIKKIGEILVERQVISEEEIKNTLNDQKRLGELLIEKNKVDYDTIETALAEQAQIKKTREKHREEIKASSLRVTSEKLDSLVDLVGELVTVQARLSQFSSIMDHSELLSIAEEVEKLTTELRDNTMDIRMMPIGTIFSKFKRLVRIFHQILAKALIL